MSTELEEKLHTIFNAITVDSPTSFHFCGRPIKVPDQPEAGSQHNETPLHQELKYTLYLNCYCRAFDGSIPEGLKNVKFRPDEKFVAGLSAANQSRSHWDPGWRIYRLGLDGEVQVNKGERHRSPVPGEYAFDAGPGIRPEVGDVVSLQVLRESNRQREVVFYYCFSEVLPDQFEGFSTVRFYFNCSPEGAVALVEELTRELNRYQVPFRLKCLAERANYDRHDAAVLYVARRYLDIVGRILMQLPQSLLSDLSPAVPLFCKKLQRGIGLAEDPGWNTSFGLHRCNLLAQTIHQSWEADRQDAEYRLSVFKKCLQEHGLDFERPYLNPGSVDLYELPVEVGIDA